MKNRTLLPILALSIGALSLAACGFRPLYGTQGAVNGSIRANMANIEIKQISDRSGQMLRNELIDRLTPDGQPKPGAYSLTIRLTESKVPLGIRKDETATRANMNQQATYVLQETVSGVVVDRGTVQSTTSYNVVSKDFGTIMAERDARARGIEQVAEEITLRVALYFNRRKTLTGKPVPIVKPPVRKIEKK